MRKTCDLVTQGLSRSRGRALVDMEFRELLFEVGTTWLPNFLSRSTRRESWSKWNFASCFSRLENVEKEQCSTTENRSTCYERLKKGSWATLVGEQRTLPYWQKVRCFTTNTIEGHWLKIKIIATLQLSARGVLIFSPLCCREKDFTRSHGLFEFCTQSHSLIVEWDWCSQYESSFWGKEQDRHQDLIRRWVNRLFATKSQVLLEFLKFKLDF